MRDLLAHYPHQERYRDAGAVVDAADAPLSEPVTIVGRITAWRVDRPPRRRGMTIARATLLDRGGATVEVPFFNQPWRPKQTPKGSFVAVSGTLETFRRQLQVKNASLTRIEGEDDLAALARGRVTPTYPATEGLASQRIAAAVGAALEGLGPLPDYLPESLRRHRGLCGLDEAVRALHAPGSLAELPAARERLVYDELLCLQLGLQQRRHRLEADVVGLVQPPRDDGLAAALLERLPFAPTGAQRRATTELAADLGRATPMHRLLQGDVGSGKTVVAAWAMLTALDHGRQAVVMAPTEVLAEQHLRTFTDLLAPLGLNVLDGPRIALLTGSLPAAQRRRVLAELAVGDLDLVIGTHALLEERVDFADLGVIVVDEQHRFGVEHRTRLRDKRGDGQAPDVLVMTATPIPRSLALTFYGDLDVTVLDELPPGREPVTTTVIERDSHRRQRLYRFVAERVAAGERAYVVCPLIEDSTSLAEVASAVSTHRRLAEEVFADLEVGLVHGRLSSEEKDEVMEAFRRGDVDVLVATTVIEVGVDVPEATVMIVEDADRFGISQLHQLRGRVGRGRGRSYCVLFSANPEESPRLEAVAATTDGFRLAEVDLELRGEGSLFDTRQSGLPDLRLARLVRDAALVGASRDDARALVEADPELSAHPALAEEVAWRYGEERLAALDSG